MFTDWKKAGTAACSVPAIRLSGSSHNWGGIIFAPNGLVQMSGASNLTMYGTIVGYAVALSGSTVEIHYDPSYIPPDPPSLELAE